MEEFQVLNLQFIINELKASQTDIEEDMKLSASEVVMAIVRTLGSKDSYAWKNCLDGESSLSKQVGHLFICCIKLSFLVYAIISIFIQIEERYNSVASIGKNVSFFERLKSNNVFYGICCSLVVKLFGMCFSASIYTIF